MATSADPAFVDEPVRASAPRPRALMIWLFVVAGLVVAMVAVGGITRLTESGLSITKWKPITGAVPPLSEADWRSEFALYQATGEYRNVTGPAGMDLAAFKFIYFWEWAHRLLGRVIPPTATIATTSAATTNSQTMSARGREADAPTGSSAKAGSADVAMRAKCGETRGFARQSAQFLRIRA